MFDTARPVPLHEPDLSGNEAQYTRECVESGWVSSVGSFVDRFEDELARYTGSRRAIAIVNGTAALHLALHLIGTGRNDEVLVPALSFAATAHAVHYLGAIPHFVDVSERTLGIDADTLESYLEQIAEREAAGLRNRATGRLIKAVVPMHTFGHPVDLDGLSRVCGRFGLTMIEDAAESLGSFYRGRHTGTWGRIGALSFNGNKIVTTGGGGALLIDDPDLADRAKHVSTTAKKPHRYLFDHDELGFNYRLPNINAAMGCAQMERIEQFRQAKRHLADIYRERFAGLSGLRIFREPEGTESNYWLNALLLDESDIALRDQIVETCIGHGFLVRPAWNLLSDLPVNRACPRADLSQARNLLGRIVSLPSSARLAACLKTA